MLTLLMISITTINASSNKKRKLTVTDYIKNFEEKYIGIKPAHKKIYSVKDMDSSPWEPAYIPTQSDIEAEKTFNKRWDNKHVFAVSDSDDEISDIEEQLCSIKKAGARPQHIFNQNTKTLIQKALIANIPHKRISTLSGITLATIHDLNPKLQPIVIPTK